MNYTYNKKNLGNNARNIFDILQNNSDTNQELPVDNNNVNTENKRISTQNYLNRDGNNESRNINGNYNVNRGGNNYNRGGNNYNRGGSNYNRSNNNNNQNNNYNRSGDNPIGVRTNSHQQTNYNYQPINQQNNNNYYNQRQHQNQNNRNNNNKRVIFQVDENSYVNDQKVRKRIIDCVYSMLPLYGFDYKILETENDLNYLTRNKYFLFPNYKGTPSFLIFIKICEDYYTCIIDRTTLKYNKDQLDHNLVNILPVKIRVNEDIYLGTIMDGVLNTPPATRPTFYVDDILYLRGSNVCNTKIFNKNINLTSYLERCYVDDEQISNVILKVNKIYELDQISALADFIKDKKYIKGITFYPELTGTKLLYIERQTNFHPNTNTNSNCNSNHQPHKFIKPAYLNEEDDNSKTLIFSMKYVSPDVYTLFLNNNSQLQEHGIALIPTLQCSKFCSSMFNDNTSQSVLVECKYDDHKKKWIPINQITDPTIKPCSINDL